jgi:hypothetical protein
MLKSENYFMGVRRPAISRTPRQLQVSTRSQGCGGNCYQVVIDGGDEGRAENAVRRLHTLREIFALTDAQMEGTTAAEDSSASSIRSKR